jgi:hypothetical protein
MEQGKNDMGLEQRRFGLGAKLNIMLIAGILLVSVGLLLITYRVHCNKVNSFYILQAQRAVSAASEDFTANEYVTHLWNLINTDEFRAVRERAVAANDEGIIREWMLKKPATYVEALVQSDGEWSGDDVAADPEKGGLYGDYLFLSQMLARVKDLFAVKSAY